MIAYTCEAELIYANDGELIYTALLPGVVGVGVKCGKPAVEKQDPLHPEFDKKFPPRRFCAEHWDEWVVLMKQARERRTEGA